MAFRVLTVFAAALSLVSCRGGEETPPPAPTPKVEIAPILDREDAVDTHSYAKPLEARVYHVALDLDVDFQSQRVKGTATLAIDAKPDATEIVLDDRGLEIEKVTDAKGAPLDFAIGEVDESLGAPLTVKIGKARKIVVHYTSAENASALQFLTPQQTAGKKHPFLFSQGQAIENRSWIPTQDSPGIRQSWEARIRVPNPLVAVMSAPKAGDKIPDGDSHTIYRFKMDKSVPPYLIALAVGNLEFRPLGLRTGVWAEPETLPKAAAELADTEKMVTAAEDLFGPYLWDRYDMLVLPPSFPFGGMENPTLTFLTPTFIAGDKSLVSLIAHELAHSWSGNLATNATWSDFWLNEGMTVWAEQRIIEKVYGKEQYDQKVQLSLDDMKSEIDGLEKPGDSALALDLKGRHPDDGFTGVPYDKGAAFLRTLEAAVGRDKFDAFMKGWFERHAFAPVTSGMFIEEVKDKLFANDEEAFEALGIEEWVYKPGIPDNLEPGNTEAFAEVDAAIAAFNEGGAPDAAAWKGWSTDERLRFLGRIEEEQTTERMAALDKALGLTGTGNNEVLFLWLKKVVANRYDPAVPRLEQFLTSQGRRKFVRPLIEALAEDKAWGREIAERVYPKARPLYHPMTTRDLDLLGLLPDAG
ncbi:M1 family metallopeptidase [Sphingomicrobium nitratireducens]|uniref:M1 family metallopeptidase n=1 Tax=Sphingomicrobium nitratireducens TaxID=2964666 RepID=UPI002240CC43|nr:M1 family metallopeptidase [Sphingomicrobium nitratireducens]